MAKRDKTGHENADHDEEDYDNAGYSKGDRDFYHDNGQHDAYDSGHSAPLGDLFSGIFTSHSSSAYAAGREHGRALPSNVEVRIFVDGDATDAQRVEIAVQRVLLASGLQDG